MTTALWLLLALADDWPNWRGPNRDGVSAEKDLPTAWGPETNILWKLPLPAAAGSTPVVVRDRIYLTSPSADGDRLLLICAGTDGKVRWEKTVSDGLKSAKNVASASPSADGQHVWAYSGNGDLVCFTADGAEVWRANLQNVYGRFKLGFGMTTTPLVHEGVLYVQLIHAGGAWVVALDAASGKELWKSKRDSDGVDECEHSYASIQFGAGTLVSHGNDYAIGHDPKTGAEIWRLGDLNPKDKYNKTLRFVSSPLVLPDLIVVPTAKNGAVVALDPRAKGKIDRGNAAHQRWRLDSGTPDVASPLVYDGLVYLSQNNGALTCLDAATGAAVYKERPDKDTHFASPAAGDGKIYLAGRGGTVSVVAAGRAFKVLAVNELKDPLDASPAISGGRIYLRGAAHLWAVGSR
ncbi:MAG TPA: PQQ-binding-like beta-propeller repeat protein [Planctomycetota bacterium]